MFHTRIEAELKFEIMKNTKCVTRSDNTNCNDNNLTVPKWNNSKQFPCKTSVLLGY